MGCGPPSHIIANYPVEATIIMDKIENGVIIGKEYHDMRAKKAYCLEEGKIIPSIQSQHRSCIFEDVVTNFSGSWDTSREHKYVLISKFINQNEYVIVDVNGQARKSGSRYLTLWQLLLTDQGSTYIAMCMEGVLPQNLFQINPATVTPPDNENHTAIIEDIQNWATVVGDGIDPTTGLSRRRLVELALLIRRIHYNNYETSYHAVLFVKQLQQKSITLAEIAVFLSCSETHLTSWLQDGTPFAVTQRILKWISKLLTLKAIPSPIHYELVDSIIRTRLRT